MFYFLYNYNEIITSISAIVVAVVAIYGIQEWKKQIRGKTDYEIARKYLRAALELRDALKYVRNPFIPIQEMQSSLEKQGFKSTDYEDRDKTNMAVYSIRWKKVQEAWTNFDIVLSEAEVSWGKPATDISKPLISLTKELFAALQMYLSGHRKKIKEELIYNQGTDDNPDDFSRKTVEAIEKIRKFLEPHLL